MQKKKSSAPADAAPVARLDPPVDAGAGKTTSGGPATGFRLLRYFSWASGVAIAAVAAALTIFYGYRAELALLAQGEQKNAAQLRLLLNHLAAVDRSTLADLLGRSNAPKPDDPVVKRMLELFSQSVAGTSIVKLKLFNPAGLTVFSTEAKQIGEEKSTYPGFVAALGGGAASQLSRRESFEAIGGTLRQIDVIGSYLPVQDEGGKLIGVVEIYDNVTQLAAAIRTTRWQVMGLSVLLLSGLYVALLIIIGRAERILREKARALEIEVDRRMKIAEELQRSVQATENARRATESAYAAALAARREAEAANNVKSELIQSLGESLRTPVNRAIGLLDVLLASLSSEPHRKHVAAAREQSLALLELIAQKTQDATPASATKAL